MCTMLITHSVCEICSLKCNSIWLYVERLIAIVYYYYYHVAFDTFVENEEHSSTVIISNLTKCTHRLLCNFIFKKDFQIIHWVFIVIIKYFGSLFQPFCLAVTKSIWSLRKTIIHIDSPSNSLIYYFSWKMLVIFLFVVRVWGNRFRNKNFQGVSYVISIHNLPFQFKWKSTQIRLLTEFQSLCSRIICLW